MDERIQFFGSAIAIGLLAAPALSEIVVGSASPQTGRYAWFGEHHQRGLALAAADINAAGGLLGEQVRLYFGDDACDPDQGVALSRKFVAIGARAVIGHSCSGPALSAGPTYEDAGIITITNSASHPELTERGWRYHFRLFGRDDEQARLAAEYIIAKHARQQLAILFDETNYSRNLAETLRSELETQGRPIKLFQGIEVDGFNWSDLIEDIRAAEIEIAYFAGRTTDVGLLARHAEDSDYTLNIIGSDGLSSEQFWLVAGEAGEGTVFTSGPDPRDWESAQNVVERLRASAFEPEGHTLLAYAALQTWAEAVRRAGTLDADVVAHTLRAGTFNTIVGEIGFDQKGDVTGLQTFAWYVWTHGAYRPLAGWE